MNAHTYPSAKRPPPTDGADVRTRYDRFSIILHWLTAVIVLSQFVLAESWEWFARPTRGQMIVAHMSFGIILSVVIVVRLVWRLLPGHRIPSAVSGWADIASRSVQWALYALLVAAAVLGFVLRWSGDESMSFFGLLLAPPFAPFSEAAQHQIEELHELTGWAIVILAAGHAAAALHHHYVLRDQVLARMLPRLRR